MESVVKANITGPQLDVFPFRQCYIDAIINPLVVSVGNLQSPGEDLLASRFENRERHIEKFLKRLCCFRRRETWRVFPGGTEHGTGDFRQQLIGDTNFDGILFPITQ